jgi:hypothetical protein
MKIDTGVQHGSLLWVCERCFGFVITTNHTHFSRLKGDLFENINQKEDAPHLHIWWSLHPDSSQALELRPFVAGDRNDFFPVDVRRHRRAGPNSKWNQRIA